MTAPPGIAAEAPVVVALGDSLTAGFGLPPEDAFPARLEQHLREQGLAVTIQNAGVSGDTTAGGRARLDWVLADKPQYAILALGANDMLRGIDPAVSEANLDAILTELKNRGIKVLLLGMQASPNLGQDYVKAFNAIYPELAQKHDVLFYPFMLDGVALDAAMNQGDGIHPNGRGVGVMVERIAPYVRRLIGG